MLRVIGPEAITSTPFDISWPDVPSGTPQCFIMNYCGKVMPHNYWVISRIMFDFADDPYLRKNPVMMYDLGNVLPDGTYERDPMQHNATAIRVLSFGTKEEDSMRARFLHDEMLHEDSRELAEKGYLGLNDEDRKRLSLALRAGLLGLASSFSEASRIIR
jgi:hypothetical protein